VNAAFEPPIVVVGRRDIQFRIVDRYATARS
jgi:hypothetical protein